MPDDEDNTQEKKGSSQKKKKKFTSQKSKLSSSSNGIGESTKPGANPLFDLRINNSHDKIVSMV
jgi:hypothetical protein